MERLIADRGRGKPIPRTAGEEPVLRIAFVHLVGNRGAAAVGVGEDEAAGHGLEIPPAFDELDRQIVEQFGMARLLALTPEVLRRGDEAGAEELLPEPVHGDSGGERVAGIDEPAG